MVDRLPPHAYLIAAVIASGAFWLGVSQIIGLFID